MKGEMEAKILMTILFFLAILGFFTAILPPELQVIKPFDFVWFGGGIIAVAGACVIATGVPCAAALGIFGVASLLKYIVVSNSWLNLVIFMPITIIIVYIVSKLARGGG